MGVKKGGIWEIGSWDMGYWGYKKVGYGRLGVKTVGIWEIGGKKTWDMGYWILCVKPLTSVYIHVTYVFFNILDRTKLINFVLIHILYI